MVKKVILFLCIIIITITAGVITAKRINEEKETTQTLSEKSKTNTEINALSNKIENVVINEVKKENIISEKQENIVDEETIGNEEEQAKKIVQEDWGEDNSVYYSYEGKDEEGNSIVCVREKSSTRALSWYYVNIRTGKFEIK